MSMLSAPPSGISVWESSSSGWRTAFGGAELEQPGAGLAAVGEAVVGEDQSGPGGQVAAAIFEQAAAGDAPRLAAEIIFVPGAAGDRPVVADPGAGVDAELAGAVLAGVGLAESEAALALARISEQIDIEP